MHSQLSIVWLFQLTGLALAQSSDTNGTTDSCRSDCQLQIDTGFIEYWLWADSREEIAYPSQTYATKTIVQIFNTVLNTTRMETSYPSDYIPESTPTNEGGTQISTVTYSRQGQNHTTDIAFPTAFVNWPDTYGWKGTLGVEVSPGITDCITASTTSTMISILSNPQDPSILRPSESIQDTLGLTYSLLPGYWDYQLFYPEKTLFPDRSVIQTCCSSIDGGPNMAPFTVTSWTTISSTSYEGDDVASTNTDSISTAQSENTVISTPSETGGSSTSSTTPDSGVTPTSQPGATSTSQHTSTVGEEGTQSSSASPSESSGGGTQQSRGARDFGFYRTQCFVLSLVLVHAMIILLL